MTTTTTNPSLSNYTDAIDALPQEAFLGSLLYFSISMADVNLENARRDLTAAGLEIGALRKNLRPVDAFKKASREFGKKFTPVADVRSELMVRAAGEDSEQAYVFLVLERISTEKGRKRRVFYENVGKLTFTRGFKKDGEYVEHRVEAERLTDHLRTPLTADEDQWLTEKLVTFQDSYDHHLRYLDSHAVRTFVREYIYDLSGICVKESGGLYFTAQEHTDTIGKLQAWVKSVGSEFHALPLLNLTDQKDMILQAFEDEAIKEVARLSAEVAKILQTPDRKIEDKTFDAYALAAASLKAKVNEYSDMLGARASRADIEISGFTQQCMALASRIKAPTTMQARTI